MKIKLRKSHGLGMLFNTIFRQLRGIEILTNILFVYSIWFSRPKKSGSGHFYVANATDKTWSIEIFPDQTRPTVKAGRTVAVR